jgi:hypothetical protein
MSASKTSAVQVLGWVGGLGASLWAGVHLFLASRVMFPGNALATQIYGNFFALTASLAIVMAVVFLLRVKGLYLPSLIFYVIDFLLLTETRVGPALFVGHPLPVNVYVVISWVLDAALIAVSLLMWRIDK